ncbi:hypothetical protein C8F04DRAFT_1181144 [Mycena alexandri]|uniref:Uncharacterized protein n=1 Tax=Mycena alexandri TaxID=1745969 RepID=A0AAD6X4Y1_9AGAR|nr:hypothetical protein C8F04DRAFT_1181144 [Mycena alexandri]
MSGRRASARHGLFLVYALFDGSRRGTVDVWEKQQTSTVVDVAPPNYVVQRRLQRREKPVAAIESIMVQYAHRRNGVDRRGVLGLKQELNQSAASAESATESLLSQAAGWIMEGEPAGIGRIRGWFELSGVGCSPRRQWRSGNAGERVIGPGRRACMAHGVGHTIWTSTCGVPGRRKLPLDSGFPSTHTPLAEREHGRQRRQSTKSLGWWYGRHIIQLEHRPVARAGKLEPQSRL